MAVALTHSEQSKLVIRANQRSQPMTDLTAGEQYSDVAGFIETTPWLDAATAARVLHPSFSF